MIPKKVRMSSLLIYNQKLIQRIRPHARLAPTRLGPCTTWLGLQCHALPLPRMGPFSGLAQLGPAQLAPARLGPRTTCLGLQCRLLSSIPGLSQLASGLAIFYRLSHTHSRTATNPYGSATPLQDCHTPAGPPHPPMDQPHRCGTATPLMDQPHPCGTVTPPAGLPHLVHCRTTTHPYESAIPLWDCHTPLRTSHTPLPTSHTPLCISHPPPAGLSHPL